LKLDVAEVSSASVFRKTHLIWYSQSLGTKEETNQRANCEIFLGIPAFYRIAELDNRHLKL